DASHVCLEPAGRRSGDVPAALCVSPARFGSAPGAQEERDQRHVAKQRKCHEQAKFHPFEPLAVNASRTQPRSARKNSFMAFSPTTWRMANSVSRRSASRDELR